MTNVRLQICTGLFRSASNIESFENMLSLLSRTARAVGPTDAPAAPCPGDQHHGYRRRHRRDSPGPRARGAAAKNHDPAARRRESGRNDPCPCGSGKEIQGLPRRVSPAETVPEPDPYAPEPSFWRDNADYVSAAVVFVATVALTVFAFPPFTTPELGYACLVPGYFSGLPPPALQIVCRHHAGCAGRGLDHFTWLAASCDVGGSVAARALHRRVGGRLVFGGVWAMPRMLGRKTPSIRLAVLLGLAGLWAVNEWTRTFFLSGFPWLPLAGEPVGKGERFADRRIHGAGRSRLRARQA